MSESHIPLPERLRPRDLSEIIGQDHLLGAGAPLRQMIDQGHLPSIIFWGPPGVGKTTIALLLAQAVDRPFISLSALNTGVKELREVIAESGDLLTPVVFIDEIHRFNKSQQDALLNAVEKGKITLIGATTENPSFEVNNALLSRCQVYTLNALDDESIRTLLNNAIQQDAFLKERYIQIEEYEALLANVSVRYRLWACRSVVLFSVNVQCIWRPVPKVTALIWPLTRHSTWLKKLQTCLCRYIYAMHQPSS